MSEKQWYTEQTPLPQKNYNRVEISIIAVALTGWGAMIFGFQFLQKLLETTPSGENVFTRFNFFNLPINVWFTAQFLPLWFILLCLIFNINIDRLTARLNSKRYPYEHE